MRSTPSTRSSLRAVDYVLKPVRADRLAEAVRRVVDSGDAPAGQDLEVPVERGGVTRFVRRSDITYVEAQGDYARLHTADGSHLLRVPLTQLETEWASAGFVRIHRSLLVALAHVVELRVDNGRCSVRLSEGTELGVSRRQTRELRRALPAALAVTQEIPQRVRVTGPPRRRQVVQRPVDLEAESPLSEVYLDSLLAAQLRLAGRTLLLLAAAIGSLPLVFYVLPVLAEVTPLGIPLSWLVLGLGVYPVLILLGWRFVVRAERNERDFVDLTRGSR